MFIYTGMRLWSLFAGFDFESITWYWKYKGDFAKNFRKYLLDERPINSLKKIKIQALTNIIYFHVQLYQINPNWCYP